MIGTAPAVPLVRTVVALLSAVATWFNGGEIERCGWYAWWTLLSGTIDVDGWPAASVGSGNLRLTATLLPTG